MRGIDTQEAIALLNTVGPEVYSLFNRAHLVRMEHRDPKVRLCGVVNAKSGHCHEDCKFCPQSVHSDSKVDCYALMDSNEMVQRARESEGDLAGRFGIVTSGTALDNESEINAVAEAIETIHNELAINPCSSLGNVSKDTLLRLKKAGLSRYHCNIETSKSFFSEICTTRPWQDSVDTIVAAKEIGLEVCCGGLLGLGESLEQRVELLDQIRELDVNAIPLNFLNPIPGTPLEDSTPMTPLECLQVIAVARLMMPTKEIRVCGGREKNLRDLQSWALISGADGLMVGGYLTTAGRDVQSDLQMIRDAGFEVDTCH